MKTLLLPAMTVGGALLSLTSYLQARDSNTLPLVEVTPMLIVGLQRPAENGQILKSDELLELVGRHKKPYHTVFRLPATIMRADVGSGLSYAYTHPESTPQPEVVPAGLSDKEDTRARFGGFADFEKDSFHFTGVMIRLQPVIQGAKVQLDVAAGLGYTKWITFSQLCGLERVPPTKERDLPEPHKIPWDTVTKHLSQSKGLLGTRESLCLDLGDLDRGRSATLVVTVVALSHSRHFAKDFSYRKEASPESEKTPLVASGAMIELEGEVPERFGVLGFRNMDTGESRGLSQTQFEELRESLAGCWTQLPGSRFVAGADTAALWPASPDIRISAGVFSLPGRRAELEIRFVGNPQFVYRNMVDLDRVTGIGIPAVSGHGDRLLFLTLSSPPKE